jgi:3-deoxy-D-manno-octulosonic-acid transferase
MDLFRADGAIREVADGAALRQAVGALAADAVQRDALGDRARRVVEAQRGALARTAQVIVSHLR